MAILWKVTRPDITMPLVMKVPLLFEGDDPSAIVSFEMEQMILPRLSGRHVPRFIAAGDFTVQPYIVMEYIQGQTLLKRLPDLPLGYEEVASLAARVATAIDDVHRQNVIHLDIKPSNILFRPNGEVVLIDFGLAHHTQLPDLMDEEFRLPYGTAPYMAPEQILGTRRDPRSDIFALGVLIYFLSTGVRPFGDPQSLKGLKKRLWKAPVPPRKLRQDYPLWLQEIVLHCLEVDPAARYPTAAQVDSIYKIPDQIELTRARGTDRSRIVLGRDERKIQSEHHRSASTKRDVGPVAGAPIIMVAIDLPDSPETLSQALRANVERLLTTAPHARVACVNVLKQSRLAIDRTLDESGP